VPVISDDEIISALPGPYGLVKVDIEGAEWDFLNYYPKVMANARYLLLDWHSWHKGGKAEGQVREEIERRGFKFVYEVRPAVSYTVNGKNVCGGAHLYENMG
jgi:hypothetical protein